MPRTTDEHNKKGAAGKRITRGFEPRTAVAASVQQATVQAELANTGDGMFGIAPLGTAVPPTPDPAPPSLTVQGPRIRTYPEGLAELDNQSN